MGKVRMTGGCGRLFVHSAHDNDKSLARRAGRGSPQRQALRLVLRRREKFIRINQKPLFAST